MSSQMSTLLLTISSKLFRKAFWAVRTLAIFTTILDLTEACALSIKYTYALTLWYSKQPHFSKTLGFLYYQAGAHSKFWGLSGSEDRGGSDNSIQFINFGRVGDKSFKEWWQKLGGEEGWVTTRFWLFRPTVLDKKCHFAVYFDMRLHIH